MELDLLEANLDQYSELRTKALEQQRYASDWEPPFQVRESDDDTEAAPSTN